MKTILKTVLAVVGLTVAASVAQAGYVLIGSDTLVDTLTKGHGAGTPTSFTVTSKVYSDGVAGPTEYEYQYTVAATAPLVDAFDVDNVGAPVVISAGPTGFTGTMVGGTVTWSTATPNTLVSLDNKVFTLYSVDPPTIGGAGAKDGNNWGDGASIGVNAPGPVPDGGLTLTLLGVGLLGIQALRRKMA